MAHLFIKEYSINGNTAIEDLENLKVYVEPFNEPLTFMKEGLEPLTPPLHETVSISLLPIGGFISLSKEEAENLRFQLEVYLKELN